MFHIYYSFPTVMELCVFDSNIILSSIRYIYVTILLYYVYILNWHATVLFGASAHPLILTVLWVF